LLIGLSTQAIAYSELQKPEHESLIQESITEAEVLAKQLSDVSTTELAVEIAV
jgi:hypothetical protein